MVNGTNGTLSAETTFVLIRLLTDHIVELEEQVKSLTAALQK